MIIDAAHLAIRANLSGSAAIIAVALLRQPVRSMFAAQAAYSLWAIPMLMALASLIPTPAGGPIAPIDLGAMDGLPAAASLGRGSSWSISIGAIWALGALVYAIVLTVQQLRFVYLLRGSRPVSSDGTRVVRAARTDLGPAVVGRSIILPLDFEARFTPAEQTAVLAHEAKHLARGDVVANAIVALIQCLCWFNPLVHLAARLIRVDQEFACDDAVIADHPDLRRVYAEALMKTQMVVVIPRMGCAWRARGFPALRDRIRLLKRQAPSASRRVCGVLLLAALTFGGGYAAWATELSEGRIVTDPMWSRMPSGADLVRFYPRKALSQELGGTALMQCRVGQAGALCACTVVREAPQGLGFGDAILQMAPLFQAKPISRSGKPVAGKLVKTLIAFRLSANGGRQP